MVQRCTNPKSFGYRWYGAKGVRVCQRWLESYENFLADMKEKPDAGCELGRYMASGHFEPGNVKWMTRAEQVAEQKKKLALHRF